MPKLDKILPRERPAIKTSKARVTSSLQARYVVGVVGAYACLFQPGVYSTSHDMYPVGEKVRVASHDGDMTNHDKRMRRACRLFVWRPQESPEFPAPSR